MPRKPFICGNWKMNTTRAEAVALAEGTARAAADTPAVEVGACPPACYIEAVAAEAENTPMVVGGQNMYFEAKGAFTGEIAGPMLVDLGCEYVILGHSERRHVFGEPDDLIARKVKAAFAVGLKPILCVGELLEERKADRTETVVRRHVTSGFEGLPKDQAARVVVAYEPVWAIGTGETATPDQAQEVHAFIRALLAERYDADLAQTVRIQYGGSVKPENAHDLLAQADIDGALVGGASLKVDAFSAILAEGARARGA